MKFEKLSYLLKNYRKRTGQSLAETSKILGCDRTYLSKLENGHERPSVIVLNNLISHFNLSTKEAIDLSREAGYKGEIIVNYRKEENMEQVNPNQEIQLNIPGNVPALYSDSVLISSSPYGLVLNFAQVLGPKNQQVVARLGMSRDHAKALLIALEKNLAESRRKER